MTIIGPNMEVTESDWQYMKAELKNYSLGKFWRDYTWHAARMAVIDPEKFKEVLITDNEWVGMLRELENYHRQENWDAFAARLARMKLISPERARNIEVNDKQWQKLIGVLK